MDFGTAAALGHWLVTLALLALVLGAYAEIARLQVQLRGSGQVPVPSRLSKGELVPVDFGERLPDRVFLVFLSYGCSGCIDISRRLENADLGPWQLWVIMRGRPLLLSTETQRLLPRDIGPDGSFTLPSRATVLHDPDRAWFKDLEIKATPTVIAAVRGRVVAQEVAPNSEWFTGVLQERAQRGRELLVPGGVS